MTWKWWYQEKRFMKTRFTCIIYMNWIFNQWENEEYISITQIWYEFMKISQGKID